MPLRGVPAKMKQLSCLLFVCLQASVTVRAQQPCRTIKKENDCLEDNSGCVWCPESNGCAEAQDGCSGDIFNPSDCVLRTEASQCQALADCVWCPEKELCRISTQGCPAEEETNPPITPSLPPTRSPTRFPTKTPTNEPTTEPTNSPTNPPTKARTSSPPTEPTTTPTVPPSDLGLPTESPSPSRSIRPSSTKFTTPPTNRLTNEPTGITSPPTGIQTDSPTLRPSTYVPTQQPMGAITDSPTNFNQPTDTPTNPFNSTYAPTESNSSNSGEDLDCLALSTERECLTADTDCFWCPVESACHQSYADCPGNENLPVRPHICAQIHNASECEATKGDTYGQTNCTWCAESSLCRAAQEECPGKGRGDPCRNYGTDASCSGDADAFCVWLEPENRCVPSRGVGESNTIGTGDIFARNPDNCPALTNADNCTSLLSCRWCPEQELCQDASDACPDKSLGVRGNPCPRQKNVTECSAVHGCLWCLGSSTCQKATQNNVCDEEEEDDFGNSTSMEALSTRCRAYDAAPECNEKSDGNCRWCDAQSICRPTQLKCDSIGGNVKIELDKKDRSFFTIEDDGLGPTDPNRVSVGLSYLYEIDSTGGTIGSSIIDLAIQQFYLTQKVGSFWGNDEIKARKTSIRADITNVGSIEMEIYEILSGGTIHTGNETWNVVEESMPAGFPRVETAFNDTSELLVFRFPRFSRKMEYDPIVPYHTATLVDLNDAIIADDAQPTSAPTNLPTNSPNSIAPTGPTLVNDGSNG
eukprot:scaffold14687_cov119-Amphora_coffeaeformis.AAC.1